MERGGVENTKKKGMAGERGWCLKTPGGFERGLDLSDKWLKLNWPARAPARQVCVLLGELNADLLLMDTLEIALVIGELNLLRWRPRVAQLSSSPTLFKQRRSCSIGVWQRRSTIPRPPRTMTQLGRECLSFSHRPPGQTVEEWVDFLTHYQADFIADLDVAHVAHT